MSVIKPPYHVYTAPKGFTPYPLSGMAELTDEELAWEYEVEWKKYLADYFVDQEKDFSDFNDFVFKVKTAPLTWLNQSTISTLERSTCLTFFYHTDVDKKIQNVKNDNRHRRDVDAIIQSIKNNTITPPIVLNKVDHERGLYLLSGNTRMCVSAAMNYVIPVKFVTVGKK